MSGRRTRRSDGGFTLVELLVAITILGIIMGAIGAMIATAFRTSSTVSDELNASRGPKLVARYWPADVENAVDVQPGAGGCGSGAAVVTFRIASVADPGAAEPTAAPGDTPDTTATWAVVPYRGRDQLVRFVCGSQQDSSVVVPELGSPEPEVVRSSTDPDRWTIKVSVPDAATDNSQTRKQFAFEVGGSRQVTTTTTVAP